MPHSKLYQPGKQCFALYEDDDETCIGVFDNIKAILAAWGIPYTFNNYSNMHVALNRAMKRVDRNVRVYGRAIRVYVVDVNDEDDYNITYQEEAYRPMKKFVEIQSSINVEVNAGLIYHDNTNPNATAENRMRISSAWAETCVLIRQGKHIYPSVVATWETTKNYIVRGDMTVGKELDAIENEEERKLAEGIANKLSNAKVKFEATEKNFQQSKVQSKAILKAQQIIADEEGVK